MILFTRIIKLCFYRYIMNSNLLQFILSKVKLATVVKGDPNAPFSIATPPTCRDGRYSFPWIAPLYP